MFKWLWGIETVLATILIILGSVSTAMMVLYPSSIVLFIWPAMICYYMAYQAFKSAKYSYELEERLRREGMLEEKQELEQNNYHNDEDE